MDPFHERLALVALAAVGRFGFALADGAVRPHRLPASSGMIADVRSASSSTAENSTTSEQVSREAWSAWAY